MALPSGYTQIEYIQSTGTQYIDTGVIPNQNTCIVCKGRLIASDDDNYLFGSSGFNNSQQFYFGTHVNNYGESTHYCGYGAEVKWFPDSYITHGAITLFTNSQTWFFDSDSLSETISFVPTTFVGAGSIYLFACNFGDSLDYLQYGKATIYSFTIISNGTVLREFIPCVDLNGVAGMYDTINGEFYTDVAGGSFIAGEPTEFKVVNSARLNGAIKASADTIRLKTDGVNQILWNELTGFADAIGSIIAAKDSKIATGTIKSESDTEFVVSGLGFAPTRIAVYLNDLVGISDSELESGYFEEIPIYMLRNLSGGVFGSNLTQVLFLSIEYVEEVDDSGDTYEYPYINGNFYARQNQITLTEDGFIVDIPRNARYGYIAIG